MTIGVSSLSSNFLRTKTRQFQCHRFDRDDIGCIDPFEYISVHEYGQSVERARNGTLGISISWADGSTGEYTDCK